MRVWYTLNFFYGIIWEFSPNVTVVGVTVKQKWSKTNSDPEYIQRIRIWETSEVISVGHPGEGGAL